MDGRPRTTRPFLALTLAASTLALGGCAHKGVVRDYIRNGFKVGPEYCKPVAPVGNDWLDAYDERIRTELPDSPDWWTVFSDSTLTELVYNSYRQNLPLRVAGLRVLESRALLGIAIGSFFPQSQTKFWGYNRTQQSLETFPNNRFVAAGLPFERAFSTWEKSFDAAWELDIWGRFRRNIEAAEADMDASIEDYDDILVCLLAETASAYVDYRTLQERLKYARGNIEIQEGSLKIAETRFENGATTELDVTQAKTSLQNTRELVPLLENQLRLANNRLCVLLGIPPRDLGPELGEAGIPSAPTSVAVGVPANLLRRRPDVRKAERDVAAQSARIGVAISDFFPAVTLAGSLGRASERSSDLLNSAAFTGFIAPQVSWPVLNYGRIKNNVRVQEARFQQLAVVYQQTVITANAEAENAINTFLQSQKRRVEIKGAVEAAERSVELAITQYRDGATDFNRVFNLQETLVNQQDRLARIEGEVAASLVAVYKALGGGWQIRCGYGARPHDSPASDIEKLPPVKDEELPSPEEKKDKPSSDKEQRSSGEKLPDLDDVLPSLDLLEPLSPDD